MNHLCVETAAESFSPTCRRTSPNVHLLPHPAVRKSGAPLGTDSSGASSFCEEQMNGEPPAFSFPRPALLVSIAAEVNLRAPSSWQPRCWRSPDASPRTAKTRIKRVPARRLPIFPKPPERSARRCGSIYGYLDGHRLQLRMGFRCARHEYGAESGRRLSGCRHLLGQPHSPRNTRNESNHEDRLDSGRRATDRRIQLYPGRGIRAEHGVLSRRVFQRHRYGLGLW